jgi:small-conductance mechanosensitive channel
MNFKAFGEINKYKATLLITVLATIGIFVIVFSIPDDSRITNQVIPITYTIIAFFIMRWIQGKQIDDHIRSGGLVYSWGRVFLIGIIGVLITVLTVFPYLYYTTMHE